MRGNVHVGHLRLQKKASTSMAGEVEGDQRLVPSFHKAGFFWKCIMV